MGLRVVSSSPHRDSSRVPEEPHRVGWAHTPAQAGPEHPRASLGSGALGHALAGDGAWLLGLSMGLVTQGKSWKGFSPPHFRPRTNNEREWRDWVR